MELSQIPAAFQSKLRLAVVAALLSGPKNFRALQDLTGATPGNLGKQLEVLEAAGFLASQKAFVGRRPNTTYRLLPQPAEDFPYEQIGISRDYRWQAGGETVPVYPWRGQAIWGLTGRITRHLTALLQQRQEG